MQTAINVNKQMGIRLLISSVTALFLLFCLSSIQPAQAFHFPWDQGHDTTEPEDPEDPGPCEGAECENDPCNGGSQGSPVYLATGHFIWSETDIDLKGRPRLAVDRTFNSHDPRIGLVGNGWSMSCDKGLLYTVRYDIENNVTTKIREYVRRLPNGKRYIYAEQANSTFMAPGLFDVVTRQADNTSRLQRRDGSYTIYSELGRLQSEVDRNSNAVNFTYDAQGRLTQKADTNGRSLTYEYNSNGLVSIIRDHTGREWQYSYDTDANLVSVTDPLNGIRQYQYAPYQPAGDGNTYSHLTRITDETGVVETEVAYNGIRVSSYTKFENTYTYQYDTVNRRVTKTDSQNSRWIFTYNATGQFTQVEAPLNRTTVYDRDADSLLTRLVDPSGTEYSYTYDQFSNRLTQSDARGTMTTTYDNEKPWPLMVTSRSGRITTLTYDSRGNPLTVTDPSGAITTMGWSAQGDLQQMTNALSNQTVIVYSVQGTPLSVSDPLGRVTQYAYDSVNNVTQMTNPESEVMQVQYDALDRVTAYTDGNGDMTTIAYDAADRITQVTAPNGQTVQYAYDIFGRLSQRTFYDGTTYSTQYRNDNLAIQVTRPDNVIISLTYDLAKRLTQRTVGNDDIYQYSYNLRDQLMTASNNTGTVTLAYDVFRRKISETVNGEASNYQYNIENETTQMVTLGITQTQQFDIRGLLNQVDVNGSTYQYTYDALARLSNLNRSAATNTIFQYDVANQLTQINHGAGQRNHQYQYDLASRISQWQGVAGETRDYAYDDTSRLTTALSGTNPETFSYDSMGNRQNSNAQFDAANRITEDDNDTYRYDVNGNRIQKTDKGTGETERYVYNGLDQLVGYQAYPDSELATAATTDYRYAYGPMGRRWLKQDNLGNNVTQFYWSGSNLVGENNNGLIRRYIFEGLTPVAFVENNEVYSYLKDHLGTAHQIVDNNSNIVWQGDYNSFGGVTETVSSIENNLRFAGQYYDEETQLHYNYFRYYDPATGRYITSDPIGLRGGLNTYGYVGGNPNRYIDPYGLAGALPVAGGGIIVFCSRFPAACVGGAIAICRFFGGCDIPDGVRNESAEDDGANCPPNPPNIDDFDDSDNLPDGWDWRGGGEPGSREGAYHNPNTGESLHDDRTHPPGRDPHITYTDPSGTRWDNFGDGWMPQ
ncbi:MAG: RHS domain-containing protein [Ectothiorhodospiraceae bacterium]|nr:RHS domain-containing protein [Ectothiorhodospiraceae bacterium]